MTRHSPRHGAPLRRCSPLARRGAPAVVVLRAVAFAICALAALASAAAAQRQPVMLVHGFNSDGASWQYVATRLEAEFPVVTASPDLPGDQPFAEQTDKLRQALLGRQYPDTTILIGHSNGGLVSRNLYATGRPLRGVMTVGTLHRGAKLADHVHDGTISAWGTGIAASAILPWRYYEMLPFGMDDWYANYLGYNAVGVTVAIGAALPVVVAGVGATGNPVLDDMKPGSSFLTTGGTRHGYAGLNNDANLARERSLLRVSIEGRTLEPEYGIFWQGVRPEHASELAAITYNTANLLELVYFYYATYWDPSDPWMWEKRSGAFLWTLPMLELFVLDPFWCYAIGAWSRGCEPSDGVVPVTSQTWPGADVTHLGANGVAHQQMKQSAAVFTRVAEGMTTTFRVLACKDQPALTIRVAPEQVRVAVGRDVPVTADARNLCGESRGPYSWTVDDPAVAAVAPEAGGLARVKGLREGVTTIRVSAGGRTAAVPVAVTSEAFTGLAISGPDMVEPRALDVWRAVPAGGVPPLAYRWKVNGIAVAGSTDQLSYRNPGSAFTIGVTATDATGAARAASLLVTVAGESCDRSRDLC